MRLGVFYFNPDYGIDTGELARALEERGFDSLYVPEHTHIPTPPHSVPRWRRAAEEVSTYPRSVCRLVLCRRGDENAAARHRDLPNPRARPYSDGEVRREPRPIVGRAVHLRHRRRLERRGKENHGAQYNTRFKLMRERILAMKALWTQEEASFHGEFVNFDPVWSWPKPAQRPHPPILLGGETDYTLRRVVEYCDGWIPRPVGDFTAKGAVDRLRRFAEKAGRDPANLSISVFRAPADKAALAAYREAGIDEALFEVPDLSRDQILQLLDKYAPLAAA